MSDKPKPAALRQPAQIKAPMIAGLFLAGIAWINYLLYVVLHINLLSKPHSVDVADPMQSKLYLGLAAMVTVGGIWYGWAQGRNNAKLLSQGTPVVGRIAGKAAMRFKGLRACSISFELNGQQIVHKPFRGLPAYADDLEVGDPIELYVDWNWESNRGPGRAKRRRAARANKGPPQRADASVDG